MSIQLQLRRGTGAQNDVFTGAAGEISVNTDNSAIRVHDGVVAGGVELARSSQIDSLLVKSVAGAVDVTLSSGEAANSNHEYTGILTGNINVIVPATSHNFTAENLTFGAYTITVKTAAGTGVLIPQGQALQLYCNGTDVEDSNSAKITGAIGVAAGNAQKVDQMSTATTRAATTTLGTTLNHTLSATGVAITAFNGVAGVTYHCTTLGTGLITYHATNLIIKQGLASIETAAGDTFDVYMLTSTTCEVRNYVRAVDPDLAQATADLRGATEQINFSRNLTDASGNVDYTVPSGRTPKWIELRCGSTSAGRSNGFSNGTTATCECTHGNGVFYMRTANVVDIGDTASSYQLAGIAVLSAGNVRLPWTKVGSPTTSINGAIICYF